MSGRKPHAKGARCGDRLHREGAGLGLGTYLSMHFGTPDLTVTHHCAADWARYRMAAQPVQRVLEMWGDELEGTAGLLHSAAESPVVKKMFSLKPHARGTPRRRRLTSGRDCGFGTNDDRCRSLSFGTYSPVCFGTWESSSGRLCSV
ncbi:hypothetical protein BD311DRAFT_81778 [Dichomitus squalens]|uniref:Uncharacterized protein n=1 Tax=Dichomitus squalens TaxID=114155 RepID=A0A4Q9MVF8_9APHY|nr:hypothetical protein BD311DRAFT_81778 [Dichomitus squalens]